MNSNSSEDGSNAFSPTTALTSPVQSSSYSSDNDCEGDGALEEETTDGGRTLQSSPSIQTGPMSTTTADCAGTSTETQMCSSSNSQQSGLWGIHRTSKNPFSEGDLSGDESVRGTTAGESGGAPSASHTARSSSNGALLGGATTGDRLYAPLGSELTTSGPTGSTVQPMSPVHGPLSPPPPDYIADLYCEGVSPSSPTRSHYSHQPPTSPNSCDTQMMPLSPVEERIEREE
eukprot:GHVH01005952.1.p1 GENE.GHVH01005952.1~~GHVH01005952.1.p1  ORF type:complete len:231 (+),score=36.65 GHVH01005952.1:127-819(+)